MHITWNTPQLREAKVILRGGGKRVPHIGPSDMHTANSIYCRKGKEALTVY